MVKLCKGCSQELPLNLFSKCKVEKDGLQRRCKHCFREYAKKNKHKMIDQTASIQGSVWIMKKSWWDKVIKELDTQNYGPLIQDSHEMIFKTWKAGGKLVVNKNTWFAHKHRSFPRTHNNGTKENPARCEEGYAYALKTWGKYYKEVIRPRFNI